MVLLSTPVSHRICPLNLYLRTSITSITSITIMSQWNEQL